MKPEPDRSAIYARIPDAIKAEVDGEIVLMHPVDWDYFELGGAGGAIWALLETPQSLDALVELLTAEFDVEPERCRHETAAMLVAMVEHGLVTIDG